MAIFRFHCHDGTRRIEMKQEAQWRGSSDAKEGFGGCLFAVPFKVASCLQGVRNIFEGLVQTRPRCFVFVFASFCIPEVCLRCCAGQSCRIRRARSKRWIQ